MSRTILISTRLNQQEYTALRNASAGYGGVSNWIVAMLKKESGKIPNTKEELPGQLELPINGLMEE